MAKQIRGGNAARYGLLLVMLGALGACSSVPLPEEQIQLSKNAVNRAVSAEATRYAPVEMRDAQDKLMRMEHAVGEHDYEQARLLAQQAEADANLAERKALASKAQQTLDNARQGIEVLRQEMLQAPNAPQTATHNAQ